ncbi:hypothetical protein ABZ766_02010 [Streptomyces sp. NPDC006670]|uniref:hypothetical protein n=1 Tax=Streptomyces sp. NPDC006670 TaxID=3154476 RepID=UPI003402E652
MSCRRRPYPWAAAVCALVAGLLSLAVALAGPLRAPSATPAAPAAHPGPSQAGVAQAGVAQAGAARAGAVEGGFGAGGPGRGSSCAPGSGGAGTEPAVPVRAGHEHGSVLVARALPEGVRPQRAECVRVPVRGPDQRAPGPVELNVMRV